MASEQLRAQWDNSPELKATIVTELRNWAVWSHGGKPQLGYPVEQPFGRTPSKCGPRCDVEKAEESELALVFWRLLAQSCEADQRAYQVKLITALKLHYLTDKAAHTKAEILGVGRRKFYAMLDDAHFAYWIASWG